MYLGLTCPLIYDSECASVLCFESYPGCNIHEHSWNTRLFTFLHTVPDSNSIQIYQDLCEAAI